MSTGGVGVAGDADRGEALLLELLLKLDKPRWRVVVRGLVH